jgi:trehalose-phosphatase
MSGTALQTLLHSVARSEQSALLLDFDGTLAPFRIDPTTVKPWADIPRLLEDIQQQGSTRVVIITGRPAHDVAKQIGLRNVPEIWGLHGSERLFQDGTMERQQLTSHERDAIDAALRAVQTAKSAFEPGLRIEQKPNAVVVHWRGVSRKQASVLRDRTLQLLQPYAGQSGMALLQFDGGIELRAGRNKGDAVRLLLDDMPNDVPAAYLGDDVTDEDAFEAIKGRGCGVLVRKQWRPSVAQVWLRPPGQLRCFLKDWLLAAEG